MSDAEGDGQPTPVVAAVAPVGASMDVNTGLHEAAKALDKRQAHLCVLANNCDEPTYTKLVEALCAKHSISLLKVDDNKKLGEWAGLCKIDKEGKARKVVACSCVVVKDYGRDTTALEVLNEYFNQKKH